MPTLSLNSDNIVETDKLTDQLNGGLISGAVVKVTLRDHYGADVVGATWPIVLPEVSAGLYRGNLPDTLVLIERAIYKATYSADKGVDQHQEWCVKYLIVCD